MSKRSRRKRKKQNRATSTTRTKPKTTTRIETSKSVSNQPKTAPKSESAWFLGTIVGLLLLVLGMVVQAEMKGREFLTFYMVCWLVLLIGSGILKKHYGIVPVILALLTFEMLGVGRMIYGASVGMTKFGILFQSMIFCGLMFLIHFGSIETSRSSTNSTGTTSSHHSLSSSSHFWTIGSSCGSSCGGESCGSSCGGGCGGCS